MNTHNISSTIVISLGKDIRQASCISSCTIIPPACGYIYQGYDSWQELISSIQIDVFHPHQLRASVKKHSLKYSLDHHMKTIITVNNFKIFVSLTKGSWLIVISNLRNCTYHTSSVEKLYKGYPQNHEGSLQFSYCSCWEFVKTNSQTIYPGLSLMGREVNGLVD